MTTARRRWAGAAALLIAVGLFFALGLSRYVGLEAVKAEQSQLEAWRHARPVTSALAFFAVYVACTALSLPGATVLTLAAGAVFGLVWGTLISSFASSLGATLAFMASRVVLRDWVQARFGDRLAAVNEGVRRDGGFYLLTLRLLPVLPYVLINLAMGLTTLRPWTFYWVSQLGMLAATTIYVNAGTQLGQIHSLHDIATPAVLASFSLLAAFPLLAKKAIAVMRARRATRRWTRPARFDRNLVVIGAGAAGLVSAYIAAAVKARVTLVESHRMGGDCLYTGCVPSKALIRTARLLSQIRHAGDWGIRRAQAEFDFADVMERVQRVIRSVEPHDARERYEGLGVEVIQGRARLTTPWEVEITSADGSVQRLTTRSVVIATGATPVVPQIPGIEDTGYLTSDTLWGLRTLPPRLLVLGGGPIGCELAQAFARLGSRVTQVELAERLLPSEDADVSDLVTGQFLEDGVDVRVGHRALRFELDAGQRLLVAEHAGQPVRIAFDVLLVAVGRAARLTGFGLEALGIETGKTVEVNGFMQTSLHNIYAAGDVAGPYQYTHVAAHQAWYATVNALFDPFKKFRVDDRVIPSATFVEPEVARVGLNEGQARERGVSVEVTTYAFEELDRAIADSQTQGWVKVLTVPGKDRILGVTIVGEHAADLLAEYVLAMKQGVGLNRLLGTIHTYPTLAEANKYAAGAWKRAHAPQRLLRWVARFHDWRRR